MLFTTAHLCGKSDGLAIKKKKRELMALSEADRRNAVTCNNKKNFNLIVCYFITAHLCADDSGFFYASLVLTNYF